MEAETFQTIRLIRGNEPACGDVSPDHANIAPSAQAVYLLDHELQPIASSGGPEFLQVLDSVRMAIRTHNEQSKDATFERMIYGSFAVDIMTMTGNWSGFAVIIQFNEPQRAFDRVCERLALSARQVEVLRLVAQGLTRSAIAKELQISQTTVQSHIRNIGLKMGVTRRGEMIARAFEAA
jgi:DNA-binding CsgD family transcriptional regulator